MSTKHLSAVVNTVLLRHNKSTACCLILLTHTQTYANIKKAGPHAGTWRHIKVHLLEVILFSLSPRFLALEHQVIMCAVVRWGRGQAGWANTTADISVKNSGLWARCVCGAGLHSWQQKLAIRLADLAIIGHHWPLILRGNTLPVGGVYCMCVTLQTLLQHQWGQSFWMQCKLVYLNFTGV